MRNNKLNLFFTIVFVFLIIVKSALAQDIDLNKGLIGYYPFSEAAIDESKSGNDGELNGVNIEKDVTGKSDGSFRWNDEDDNIKLPIDMNPVSLPQITICAWVKLSNYRDKVIVVSNDDRGGDRKIYTENKDKKRVWAISNGEGGFIGKTPTERGKWTFLVATYDNKNKKAAIYVDGEKNEGTAKVDMGSDYILIGANPHGNDDFEALIDEVRIYNRILKKSEIDSLQNLVIPEPPIQKVEEEYYYLTEMKLSAKSSPSKNAKDVSVLEKGDTLRFKEAVPATGGKFNEWLKIEIDGKTAYVPLKYLNKETISEADMSEVERFLSENMKWDNWVFWVVLVVLMLLSFWATMKFESIDGLLAEMTGNDYENGAFLPFITAFAGFGFAILMVIWQDSIEYYFTNFSFWPVGYGFVTWLVWGILAIISIVVLFLAWESFTCGNIFHGILRLIIQLILSLITFVSVFVITIAIIVIAIILIFGSILLGAAFRRVVVVREY